MSNIYLLENKEYKKINKIIVKNNDGKDIQLYYIIFPEKYTLYFINIIGRGTNGIIYDGIIKYKNEKEYKVAIKITNDKNEKEIVSDINIKSCRGILPVLDSINKKIYIKQKEKYIQINYIIIYQYMNAQSYQEFINKNINIIYISNNNYLDILKKIKDILICLLRNNYIYTDLKPNNILIDYKEIKENKYANIYLGDLGGIKKDDKKIVDTKYFISTYRNPLKKCTGRIVMSWEFLIFSILINPNISNIQKKYIINITRHDYTEDIDEKDFDNYTLELKQKIPNIYNILKHIYFEIINRDNYNIEFIGKNVFRGTMIYTINNTEQFYDYIYEIYRDIYKDNKDKSMIIFRYSR